MRPGFRLDATCRYPEEDLQVDSVGLFEWLLLTLLACVLPVVVQAAGVARPGRKPREESRLERGLADRLADDREARVYELIRPGDVRRHRGYGAEQPPNAVQPPPSTGQGSDVAPLKETA